MAVSLPEGSVQPLVTETFSCRLCGGEIITVLSLGDLCLSGFPKPDEPDSRRAPLDFGSCWNCGLVQLRHAVDPTILFGEEYWYRSGINETMVAELQDIVKTAMEWVGGLSATDWVVDIGANDGTLLASYPHTASLYYAGPDNLTVAYEPSSRWRDYLYPHARIVVPHPFPPPHGAYRILEENRRAKIITSIACFYDVADPRAFVQEIKRILHPQGVWILQLQDLDQMLRATAFDNICHEHVCYYSLRAIRDLCREEGLVVRFVQGRAINGGSLRVIVQHERVGPEGESVTAWLEREKGCESWERLEGFAADTLVRVAQIQGMIIRAREKQHIIDLCAASTKANTLLQVTSLGKDLIRRAWERTPEKWGRETVGTRIPIVSEEEGRKDPPDLLLIGAWQFREALLKREAEYLKAGGTVVLPLPQVEIVKEGR